MKYLDILKEENPVHDDQEKPKKRYQVVLQKVQKGSGRNSEIPENTYHDELQKVQKGVFTVFTVGEGSTFPEKTNKEKCQKCDHKEELPPHGSGCNHIIKGYYQKQWGLLDILEKCPRGLWN